ncbi:MAG: LUD domain-containing protein [Coriobacteriales bacterium]|jgi:L-lactate dehydrogenase complex protein LldG|nr:LUD domain-containing protein [Coriobacteriales bacterium]
MGNSAKDGKDAVLAEVRSALADVKEHDPYVDVPRVWETGRPTAVADPIELFIDRLIDYKAKVTHVAAVAELPECVLNCLRDARALSCCVPPGLQSDWLAPAKREGIVVRADDPPLSKLELDGIDAVVTNCRICMAETGTIALDHRADQGRRIISLLPDTHVCVVEANQIVSDVPEAVALLEPSIREGYPITWISGPSATSDIELSRVEGVHGPRNLYVIIIG